MAKKSSIWYKRQNKINRIWMNYAKENKSDTEKGLAIKSKQDPIEDSIRKYIKSYENIHEQPVMKIIAAFNSLSTDLKDNGRNEKQTFLFQNIFNVISQNQSLLEEKYLPLINEIIQYLKLAENIEDEYEYYYTVWYAHNILKLVDADFTRFVQDMPDPDENASGEDTNIPRVGDTGLAPYLNPEITRGEFESTHTKTKSTKTVGDYILQQGLAKVTELYETSAGMPLSVDLVIMAHGISENVLKRLEKMGYIFFEDGRKSFSLSPEWRGKQKLITGNF